MKITVWIDGGCKRNGMPDAQGYATVRIKGHDDKTWPIELSTAKTNNEAEFGALLSALDLLSALQDHPGHQVEIRTDSQDLIGWVMLNWKIKTDHPRLERLRGVAIDGILELMKYADVDLVKADRDEIVQMLGH
ncbi:MAG: hypothetical protein A2Y38_23870 [Spirochaetes bacterium GWB1_59_5]|nr:MAG: hypothetical protein A2Y38_23870 [Spirochaetes bacterium GWB1_59_5]